LQVENYNMKNKYTKIKLLFILSGILLSSFVYSQNENKTDSIFLNYSAGKGLTFEYTVEPGNTVYSISKKFDVEILIFIQSIKV
jgi:hypothetical protein